MQGIVNPKDIKKLVGAHKLFAAIHDQYGPPPNWSRPPGFISLSKIILEQQVSLASALAHFTKLDNYLREFSPKEILKLTDAEMLTCQVSRQKAKYLRHCRQPFWKSKLTLKHWGIFPTTKSGNN